MASVLVASSTRVPPSAARRAAGQRSPEAARMASQEGSNARAWRRRYHCTNRAAAGERRVIALERGLHDGRAVDGAAINR